MHAPEAQHEYAAIDLGSNSFHLLLAREEHGELVFVDRVKEMVRLAAGLNSKGELSMEARRVALQCLLRFRERLRGIPPEHIRAVGTNTLRKIRDRGRFLHQAEDALGHEIDIIAGQEEARLIFLGVSRVLPTAGGKHLLMDIGGGSTELVLAHGTRPLALESLDLGCVGITQQFFPDRRMNQERFVNACTEVALRTQEVAHLFERGSWKQAIGSSGTIRAAARMLRESGIEPDGSLTLDGIQALAMHMLDFGRTDRIRMPGLSDKRAPVMIGGLAILLAMFDTLGIEHMQASEYALREGVLYDLLGREHDRDPRETSVQNLMKRWQIDPRHAGDVESSALALAEQVRKPWALKKRWRKLLSWAARLHEIGLQISHEQHHLHGAYLARHADLPGFSERERLLLAQLIRLHRGKVRRELLQEVDETDRQQLARLAVLLRLAVLRHRNRRHPAPALTLRAEEDRLHIGCAGDLERNHPLTWASLERESRQSARLGVHLQLPRA